MKIKMKRDFNINEFTFKKNYVYSGEWITTSGCVYLLLKDRDDKHDVMMNYWDIDRYVEEIYE